MFRRILVYLGLGAGAIAVVALAACIIYVIAVTPALPSVE